MMNLKAQSAVMDGFFFMLICGAAATLMFYTTGLYGASTNRQIITIYNYEYEGTALVTLHYAKDADGKWFWLQMKDKLKAVAPAFEVQSYLGTGNAKQIWSNITETSPSQDPVIYFRSGPSKFYCYDNIHDTLVCCTNLGDPVCGPLPPDFDTKTVFSSSVNIVDNAFSTWEVALQLYY